MDDYHPDRSWVYDRLYAQRGRLKPASAKGVEEFITKAINRNQFVKDGGIRCPCHNCKCRELGRDPTLDEVFLKTHTKKKDNSWVDERAKKTYETFQGKLQQASKNGEASNSCSQVVNAEARLDIWVQSVGGKNKWMIYGAGDRSSLYRPGVASLVPDFRPSRGCANVLSQHSNEIAVHISAFEERAKAAEHEAREELRKAEQRRQEDEQRTIELQIPLATLAKSVVSIQAESSRRRRHPDYDEDESNDDDDDE